MDAVKDAIHALGLDAPKVKPVIWCVYHRDAYTTARHLEEALRARPDFTVYGIGPGHPHQDGQRINLLAWTRHLPAPSLVLLMDGASIVEPIGIESFGCPVAYYAIDTHLNAERGPWIYQVDHVYLAHRRTLGVWKVKSSSHLPVAADSLVHRLIPHLPVVYDIAFVGGVDLAEVHWGRREALKRLASSYKVLACRTTGAWMSFAYSKSKLVFNQSVKHDVNMRVFEAMACQRVLVTDHSEELEQMGLKDGEHCLMFRTADELMEKVAWALSHDEERETIAQAGFQWFKAAHTYDHRAQRIVDDMSVLSGEKANGGRAAKG